MSALGSGDLWRALEAAAGTGAASAGLRVGEEEWSLAELLEAAAEAGEWLRAEGACAPLFLTPRSSLHSVACLLGAIRIGAVPVLADAAWTEAELSAAMARCGARCQLLADGEDGSARSELVAARERGGLRLLTRAEEGAAPPAGAAFGRFTSGSTGPPRSLAFSEAAALAAARGWAAAAAYGPGDEVLCLATLNNGLGFNASLFPALLSGARLTLHSGRLLRTSIRRALARVRPTVLVAFPFAFEQIVADRGAGDSLERLRLAISSAARLGDEVKTAWERIGGPPVCDYYGLAEVGPCTFNADGFPGSLGKPLEAVRLKIVDEHGAELGPGARGRVRIKAPSVASGYLDAEDPPFAASLDASGYFVSKDLGHSDEEGRLFLGGRVGRQVNIAGRKIEPSEVEAVLSELDGVRAAVVVARPLASGSVLAAYLEAEGLDRQAVVAHCQERLASYKIPQSIQLLDELPRSSTGKVSLGALVGQPGEGTR